MLSKAPDPGECARVISDRISTGPVFFFCSRTRASDAARDGRVTSSPSRALLGVTDYRVPLNPQLLKGAGGHADIG
jgi:hypothetical protein